jgi:hypothetical protein
VDHYSNPISNIQPINLNHATPSLAFVIYAYSSNVEPKHEVGKQPFDEVVGDGPYIFQVHMGKIKKQGTTCNFYNQNSPTLTFFKVNNNQPIALNHNQIMTSIIYHSEVIGPKILALHTRCCKWL